MSPAIMLSFVIPAIVAVTLTVLLIKERDYLFNKKNTYSNHPKKNMSGYHHSEKKSENNKNDRTFVDYSGGLMGL